MTAPTDDPTRMEYWLERGRPVNLPHASVADHVAAAEMMAAEYRDRTQSDAEDS
jgi:hypothetical protein